MKSRISKDSWILNRPIAHRGLHGDGVPENSKAAYLAAIASGYPIEMNVQLTADEQLVCFHDDNLKRMTGEDALILWNDCIIDTYEKHTAADKSGDQQ